MALPGDAADLLGNARHRASVCSALLRCVAFDRAAAPLLLFAGAAEGGGSYGGAALVSSAVAASANQRSAAGHGSEPGSVPQTGAVTGPGNVLVTANGVMAVLLPRMPAGLSYIANPRAYEALARVPRTLGRLAAAADAANTGVEIATLFPTRCAY